MKKATKLTPAAVWGIILGAEAVALAVLAGLRLMGVFSFRMAYLAMVALVLVAADLVALAVVYDKKHGAEINYQSRRRVFFVLLGITVVSSIPLFTNYIMDGHDISFHLFRIEGIRDGLAEGQFPVRIHPNTLYGYGYANPQFYPELLLYFPALLRLCGFSIIAAYKTFLFCLNGLTAFLSYHSFRKIFDSRKLGLLGSGLYTLSLYRLVNVYTRAAVGEASAMAFLPLVAWGLYQILTADTDQPGFRWAFLPLAVGMTGLVATHLLSCEMVLPLLVIVCLVCIKRTLNLRRLASIGMAALVTVLLGLSFLVPMLDYMNYDTYQVFQYSVTDRAHEALNVAQLFPLLPNAVGESNPLSQGIAGEMPLGIGFVFLLVAVGYPVLRKRAKGAEALEETPPTAGLERLCWILGLALLWMTTNLFPWSFLYKLGGLPAQLASMLQFPWRLLAPATLALCICACGCFRLLPLAWPEGKGVRTAILCTVCVVGLFTAVTYCDRFLQESEALKADLFSDLDQTRSVGDAEYLPYGASGMEAYLVSEPANPTAGLTVEEFIKSGAHIAVTVDNAGSQPASVELPLICYLGYAAKDAAGQTFPLDKGTDTRLRLTVPAGYSGTVSVGFVERPLWRVAEAVTLLTAVALVTLYMFDRKRKEEPNPEICI